MTKHSDWDFSVDSPSGRRYFIIDGEVAVEVDPHRRYRHPFLKALSNILAASGKLLWGRLRGNA